MVAGDSGENRRSMRSLLLPENPLVSTGEGELDGGREQEEDVAGNSSEEGLLVGGFTLAALRVDFIPDLNVYEGGNVWLDF